MWLLAMASGAAVFILTPDVWTLALAAGIVLVPLAGMAGAFAARKAVAVEVILPRGAEKGRDTVIAFRGTNGTWLPLPRVEDSAAGSGYRRSACGCATRWEYAALRRRTTGTGS